MGSREPDTPRVFRYGIGNEEMLVGVRGLEPPALASRRRFPGFALVCSKQSGVAEVRMYQSIELVAQTALEFAGLR